MCSLATIVLILLCSSGSLLVCGDGESRDCSSGVRLASFAHCKPRDSKFFDFWYVHLVPHRTFMFLIGRLVVLQFDGFGRGAC